MVVAKSAVRETKANQSAIDRVSKTTPGPSGKLTEATSSCHSTWGVAEYTVRQLIRRIVPGDNCSRAYITVGSCGCLGAIVLISPATRNSAASPSCSFVVTHLSPCECLGPLKLHETQSILHEQSALRIDADQIQPGRCCSAVSDLIARPPRWCVKAASVSAHSVRNKAARGWKSATIGSLFALLGRASGRDVHAPRLRHPQAATTAALVIAMLLSIPTAALHRQTVCVKPRAASHQWLCCVPSRRSTSVRATTNERSGHDQTEEIPARFAGRSRGRAGSVRDQPRSGSGGRQDRGPLRQAAESRLLQCRPAGDVVRAGQAGGGILGQAVQRRGDVVRRRTRRAEAARGDRQHGLAEMGFCRHSGLRHRHADRTGQQDDRRPARLSSTWTR